MVDNGQGECFSAYAQNISRSGLFIASINPPDPGELLYITLQIPDTDINLRCQCEVVRTRLYDPAAKLEPGYGIRFIDLPEDVAIRIDSWVLLQGLVN